MTAFIPSPPAPLSYGITGVEMFCTHRQGVGATLNILLVPLENN